MKAISRFAFLSLSLTLPVVSLAVAWSQDVVHLKNGVSLRGRILSITPAEVSVKAILDSERGEGFAMHRYHMGEVAFVDMEESPEIAALLDGKGNPAERRRRLAELAENRRGVLGVPHTNAGAVLLAWIEAILAAGEPAEFPRCLGLCEAVAKHDWNAERRERARQLKLSALIAGRRLDEALREAAKLFDESKEATSRIEAQWLLAEATFAQLQRFVDAHPRWRDDDQARPEHERLYHTSLDRYLYAPLFHGSLAAPAARGLGGAWKVYRFERDDAKARRCAEDLVRLYPDTPEASRAARWLASRTDSHENDVHDP